MNKLPPENELAWAEGPIQGVLLITAQIDSNGDRIKLNKRYMVAKHKPTGNLVILPLDEKTLSHKLLDKAWKDNGTYN